MAPVTALKGRGARRHALGSVLEGFAAGQTPALPGLSNFLGSPTVCDVFSAVQGDYFFIDLEGAGRADSKDGSKVNQALLNQDGFFLPVSDMRMVGELFTGIMFATPANNGLTFRQRLQQGCFSNAQEALDDPWFAA